MSNIGPPRAWLEDVMSDIGRPPGHIWGVDERRGGAYLAAWCEMRLVPRTWYGFLMIFDDLGMILGSFWDHFGIILGSFWDVFGMIFGCFWDDFGMFLG